MILDIVVIVVGILLVAIVAVTYLMPVQRRLAVTWGPNEAPDPERVVVKRRVFPWPSTNVTLGSTIYEGGDAGINDATLRHELQHVRQFRTHGWLWVLTHPKEREADARTVEQAAYPIWSNV